MRHLRIATYPQLKRWHEALKQEGEQILTQPPGRYELPDGVRLLNTSKRVVRSVSTLGMLYRLEKEERYKVLYKARA